MIKLTMKDAANIYRALGMIEGVSVGMSEEQADTLISAIELIEATLRGV